MKRSNFTTLGLLTLGVILSPVYAFEGIVYEATVDGVGTITICNPDDDTQCLTMMDRNLGASVAGIGEDADGYTYQRGNNYGFPKGTISSTTNLATWDDSYNNSGYYSETFIKSSSSPYDYWSDGARHDNLWGGSGDNAANGYGYTGGVVLNVTGRQGPCPDGWHVPSQGEWAKTVQWWSSGYKLLGNTFTTLNISLTPYFTDRIARRAFQDDFKIPFAGYRDYSASLYSQGSHAYLWSSSPSSTSARYFLNLSNDVNAYNYYSRANASSVRCFKDSVLSLSLYSAQAKFESNGATSVGKVMKVDDAVIAPSITRYGYEIIGWSTDSGATTAQYLVGDSIPDSDTVYYAITRKFPVCEETLDETVDTLTICNPSNTGECLTLMDKNLGASVAGIGPDSDGCMYQWGNNYCFPSVGTIASTGTLATWDDRFNNSGYYGEIFIKSSTSPYDYWSDGVKHDNLWGGTTNEAAYPVTNPTDRRGPCPEGYHVPSFGEWDKILTWWTASNNDSSDARIKSRHFESNFLIPFAGYRYYSSASLSNQGSNAALWSSSPSSTSARYLYLYSSNVYAHYNNNRAYARSVRCFKDSVLSPHSVTFLPNGAISVGGATPVFNCTDQLSECNPGLLTGCTTTVAMPDITRDGREVLGRSTDSGATVAQYHTGEIVVLSGDTIFYAITKKTYTATFNANGADSIGADTLTCDVYNTETICREGPGTITICNPSDTGECLTMSDRNLGAGVSGTGQCSYGNYYQRGNNYGFPSTGDVTTGGTQVDCTPYGVGNNYSDSTFIVGNSNWCTSNVNDLWGGSEDNTANGYGYTGGVVLNLTGRQGPCPEGYHVPSIGEWNKLLQWWTSGYLLEGNTITLNNYMGLLYFVDNTARIAFRNQFFIPFAGYRTSNLSSPMHQEVDANILSSSPNGTELYHYFSLMNTYYLTAGNRAVRGNASSVRCFKNLSLDSTSAGHESNSIAAPSINRERYEILGWSRDPNATGAEYGICDEIPLSGDTTLYAITKKMILTTTFLPGYTVNTTLKNLANSSTNDTLIQQIVRTGSLAQGFTTGLLSTSDSQVPIIAWYDSGTIYYYTDADIIYLNQDSYSMFKNMRAVSSIDTSGWDTSNVTDMGGMFYQCYKLIDIDVSNWDTSNVTNMTNMFYRASVLTGIDVSNWDMSNVNSMSRMFFQCYKLEKLDVSSWNMSGVSSMQNLFYGCSSLTELDVSDWNVSRVTNMSNMFFGCSSLTGIDVSKWDTSSVTDMSSMFQQCSHLTDLDVSKWNTSNVTNMTSMFHGCHDLTGIDVSDWNVGKVTNMNHMFYTCDKLMSLDVSKWDTSKVTNMGYMFNCCYKLTDLNVSNWDVSGVNNMEYMFFQCRELTGLDVSNWDTSSVTNMQYMFYECSNLTSLDLSSWDTSSVTNMQGMFNNSVKLNTIYASTGFITSGVTNSTSMFSSTKKLVGGHGTKYNSSIIDKTRAVLDSESESGYLTYDIAVSYRTRGGIELTRQIISVGSSTVAPTITGYHVLGYYANTGFSSIFNFSQKLRKYTEVYVDWDGCETGYLLKNGLCVAPVTATFLPGSTVNWTLKNLSTGATVTSMYNDDTLIQQIVRTGSLAQGFATGLLSTATSQVPIVAWYDNGIIYYYTEADIIYLNQNSASMFYRIKFVTYIDTSGWDTSIVTEMSSMFNSCSSLVSLNVSNWNTSNVTNMGGMFMNSSSLTSLDVSNWSTSNVTSMSSMFAGCSSLTSLDVSNFDTSKVTSMSSMFAGCSSLTSLDVSNFDTSNVTNMWNMFMNCSSLTSLDVSNFDTSKVTYMDFMFSSCSSLIELDVSNFDTSNVTNMWNMFSSCSSLTSLDVSNFDTSNVTNMDSMFSSCSSLIELDVSNFDTSKVTNMYGMFRNCKRLTGLNVSNFDTSKVTNMSYMFGECNNLLELNINNFDTSNVTDMGNMFRDSEKLNTIYASTGFITSGVTNSSYMFDSTNKLVGGHGTKRSSSYKDKTRAKLDSETVSGYFTYDIVVSYRTRSGVELARQIIDVRDTTVAPTIIRTGYAVSGWYMDTGYATLFDFSQALRKYTELYVMWKCDTGYMLLGDGVTCIPLTYTVKHFIKNAGELSYTLSGTEVFTGIAGEYVTLSGFSRVYPSCIVYSRGSLTGDTNGPGVVVSGANIAGDGSTVINLFYDRNTYTVDLSRDFGIDVVEGAGTYECGQEVQIKAYPIEGYHFDVWEGEVN